MENITYLKNNSEFSKELKLKVKEYFAKSRNSKYGNGKILLKTSIMMIIYFVPYILMVSGNITSVVGILGGFFIMGLGLSGIGMVTMHDANHGSFSSNKTINAIFSKSLYLLGGFPANWRVQHNILHHGFTNIDGVDEDIAPIGVLRFSPHQPLKKIHRFQHIYAWFFYSLMTISWVTIKDFKGLLKYKKMGKMLRPQKSYAYHLLDLIISKILYYAVLIGLPVLLLPANWYWVIVGFILMHLVSGFILSIIFQMAHVVPSSTYPVPEENDNTISTNREIHQLYTTSDFSPKNRLFSWLIGGLNYQVIHHLFPGISHVHYRNLAPIVQQTTQKYNLPYYVNNNFFVAVGQHVKMLKQLGRN